MVFKNCCCFFKKYPDFFQRYYRTSVLDVDEATYTGKNGIKKMFSVKLKKTFDFLSALYYTVPVNRL